MVADESSDSKNDAVAVGFRFDDADAETAGVEKLPSGVAMR